MQYVLFTLFFTMPHYLFNYKNGVCGSMTEHLFCIEKVPTSIPGIVSKKNQVAGDMKELYLEPWRVTVTQS